MNKRRIITFSGRMRSGKDVLCKALEKKYGAKTFSLATHLKKICCGILDIEVEEETPWNVEKLNEWKNCGTVFGINGLTLTQESLVFISEYTGLPYDKVVEYGKPLVFYNVREMLQKIGTDLIRSIDSEWHIKKTLQDISKLSDGITACVDDIRFKNELDAFRKVGSESFFIIRNNAETVSNHASETGLFPSDFTDDRIILNIGTEEELCEEFSSEYKNNFKITVKKPILLIEFPYYRNVKRHFGTERTLLVDEIIRQNGENKLFLKDGLISFRNNSCYKIKEVLEEMGISGTYQYEMINGRFIIDCPIVYENLKRWL